LCYSCPPLRWGTDCFPAEGYDLYDAVRVSTWRSTPDFESGGSIRGQERHR
jgi:hypothetical protein